MKTAYVYILASKKNGTLYTGVTSDLMKRLYEHNLVYYEDTNDIRVAIEREKEIKGWNRIKKIKLIESVNPEWKDISEDWYMDSSLRSE
jgi:putative endonuclease